MRYKVTWSQNLVPKDQYIIMIMDQRLLEIIMMLGYIIYEVINVIDEREAL